MKFEVIHKGRRYWAHLFAIRGGYRWNFWSDHKWPFYHGHLDQRVIDKQAAYKQFIAWLPFAEQGQKNAAD